MTEEKFKLQLNIKSGNKDVDDYIQKLHEYIIGFETSSIKKLIVSLDKLSEKISEDVDKIANGEAYIEQEEYDPKTGDFIGMRQVSQLALLSDDKNDKTFDRVMVLLSKVKDFENVCKFAEAIRPDIIEKRNDVKESNLNIDLSDASNVFEALQEKVVKGKKK